LRILADAESSCLVFMARNSSESTSWVFEESRALICSMVRVKSNSPWKMWVCSAKKQKISRAKK
jgi:hypothetical protein